MACDSRITANVTSDCSTVPVGGLELIAYIFNRIEFSPVYDVSNKAKITDFTLAAGKVGYKYSGVAKNLVVGHSAIMSDDIGKTFKHMAKFPMFETLAAAVKNGDAMNDLIVIVEYKQKNATADGVFVAYGVGSGLWNTKDDRSSNTSNAIRLLEFETRDQEGEPVSQYNFIKTDYATTKSKLEASLTVI